VPVTDIANGCFRSSSNYASLTARALDAELDDRSCGAAEVRDLFRSQLPGVPPQLDALNAEVDLVTLGMGGNDEGVFSQLVNRCPQLRALDPAGTPCRDAMRADGGDVLLASLERTRGRLTTALERIHRRAPGAEVLVVGYPQIVDADNICARLPMARGDYAYAEKINLALTEALRRAAEATGSGYVDLWDAGHDICSDDPWVNGSVTDQRRAAAYHPFAEGQAAVAERVVAALQQD
jgi:lysophospholipase L1-like esterase